MRKITFLLVLILAIANSFAAEKYQWKASTGTPLGGSYAVTSPDGKVAVYKPEKVSVHNYIDVARIAVNQDEVLTYSVEYKIPEKFPEGTFSLRVICFGEGDAVVKELPSRNLVESEGWRVLSFTFAVPLKTKSVLLRILNTGTYPLWVKSATLSDAKGDELDKVSVFAKSDEEKIVLQSHTIHGNPRPVVNMDYKDAAPGDKYSMKIVWDHDQEGFGIVDINSPMEVPAGGKRRLEKVEFYLKPIRNTGDLKIIPMVLMGDVNFCSENINFGQINFTDNYPADKKWHKFEYNMPENSNIANGNFLLRLHGRGETTFRLGLPKFYYSDGTVATGFSVWKDPLWQFPDKSAEPFKSQYKSTDGMVVCDAILATQVNETGRNAIKKIKDMYPNFGNDLIYNIGEGLKNRQWYEDAGVALLYQNVPNGLWQLALSLDQNALSYNPDSYGGLDTDLHKYNTANPVWREVYSRWADRMKDYGIPEVMSIDCIFIYNGDAEQYEPFFIGFLNGKDEGYQLKGEDERKYFADYFKSYTGFEPTPAFFGWGNWSSYRMTASNLLWNATLPTVTKRRAYLDVLLRHYAFLMYNVRLGEELEKRDIAYYLMNNGDNWQNGNDWQFNARAKGIGGFVEETFFYHPSCIFHSMTDAMSFRQFYKKYGTKHRLIQEDGQGGHGVPYWDVFNTFALVSTITAGTSYNSLQIDWPFESVMLTLAGQGNDYTIPRYNTFVSMASAYTSQREIGLGEIAASTKKTLLFHENYANIAINNTTNRLGNVLINGPWYGSNANFNLFELDYVDDAKVLFNDYYALPVGGAKRLTKWLNDKPDRVLVLSGFTAGKTIDGSYWGKAFGWDIGELNAPEQFSSLIGNIKRNNEFYLADKTPDEVLLQNPDGSPMLSCYNLPENRKVYFYSNIPSRNVENDKKVVDLIMSNTFESPQYTKTKGDSRLFIYNHADNMKFISFFSYEAMERFKMDDPWVTGANVYRFEQPEVDNAVEITATPGSYNLYGFMKNEVMAVTVPASGKLELTLKGQACELYYLIPSNNNDKLEQLKQMRVDWHEKLVL